MSKATIFCHVGVKVKTSGKAAIAVNIMHT